MWRRYWLVLMLTGWCWAEGPSPGSRLGSSHAAGKYSFNQKDFLNEGAIQIADGGMRVIKIWFSDPQSSYPWNSQWPGEFKNYVETAQHPYFQEVFRRPFETYVLTIFDEMNFQDGFADPKPARLARDFYELAKYLLVTYRGTGKVFILGHHEGDWKLRSGTDKSKEADPGPTAIAGMIRWYNARQAGTEQARREVRDTDVKVYHAAEVNLVEMAMEGRPTVTNDVLPMIRCDLVSYSAWDSTVPYAKDVSACRKGLRTALDYLAEKVPDSKILDPRGKPFGNKNIFISEYGAPEQEWGERGARHSANLVRAVVEEGLDFGCPWIIYWQVYCNECCAPGDIPCKPVGGANPGAQPSNSNGQCRGFWLRRVDGTFSPAWDYFVERIGPCPKPPMEFEAKYIGPERAVRLSWTAKRGDDKYRIERSAKGAAYRALSSPAGQATDYLDRSVVPGNTYAYRIRAESGRATSPWFYASAITNKPAP